MANERPDWLLQVKMKDGEDRGIVGAGWNTEYGGISIKLSPCVTLTDRDDIWILLKPNERKDDEPKKSRKKEDE